MIEITISQKTAIRKGMEQRILALEEERVMKVSLTQEEEVKESKKDNTHQEEGQKVTSSQMPPDMESDDSGTPALLPQVFLRIFFVTFGSFFRQYISCVAKVGLSTDAGDGGGGSGTNGHWCHLLLSWGDTATTAG